MFHYRPYARVENGQHSNNECVMADDKQEFFQTLLLSRYGKTIDLLDHLLIIH